MTSSPLLSLATPAICRPLETHSPAVSAYLIASFQPTIRVLATWGGSGPGINLATTSNDVSQLTEQLLQTDCPHRWLVKKHKDQKAVRVLMRLRRTDEEGVQMELGEIQATVTEDQKGSFWQMWQALISWKILQR